MSWIWLIPIFLSAYLLVRHKFSNKNPPLPPGPPADPIIGHLRSIPPTGQDMYFYELGLKYGDVVHLKIFGKSLVILNSVQAAVELLDKRGSNNSDRPLFPIYALMGIGNLASLERYGTEWRRQRAMIQQYFNKERSKEYRSIQIREARFLASNLLTTTEDKLGLFIRFSTTVIIDISCGHQIESPEDPYFKTAYNCCQLLSNSGPPGGTPVDFFPLLSYFPSWLPGTYYANFARRSSTEMAKLFDYPYVQVEREMSKGIARPSFLAYLLEDFHTKGEEDETELNLIKRASAVVYLGGAETTSSTLSFFLLAMVLYPQFQIKAQEEIDRVLGSDHLPEIQDREHLPYIECILQETIRWHQPLPSGVPHKSMVDDVYNGMFIPKGTVIIPNVRSMTLDEAVYKDPFKFNPDRYIPSPEGRGEPYPNGHFGFGRRICPGRHLAEDSAWIAMATILATTTISRAITEDGKEIVPQETVVATGITTHPSSFPCHLKPRNGEAFKLLQRFVDSA